MGGRRTPDEGAGADGGEERALPFPRAEYDRRLAETRGRMEEAGLDALVVTDPANMNYLTGYDAWSFYVPQAVVVTPGDDPTWVGRKMDAGAARATTWLDADHVRAYTDEHVQSSRDVHPMDFVASVMSDLGAGGGRVGVEMDAHYYTARSDRRLRDGLPGASFADATLLVNRVRLRKSEREIRYMEQAGRLADEGMRRGMEAVAPGVPESEVAAEIYRGLVGGTEDHGGDYPAIVPLLPAGLRSTTPHLTWSDRRYREGDPVIVELAGVRHRYHAPLARTAFVGEPPAEVAEAYAVLHRAQQAAVAAATVGAPCEEVDAAARGIIAEAGWGDRFIHRTGHGIGVEEHEDPYIVEGNRTPLAPGHAFSIEPGIYVPGRFGMRLEDIVVAAEGGPEPLNRADHALAVVGG
ncbi:MAG: M24 family metallopeptidase [Gemmatimonadota bacterium]